MLRLVEATGCHKHPHNSFEYVHSLTEIMKLAFADRHAYYGDPKFVDVPLDRLMSSEYTLERADTAWPDLPPAGLVGLTVPQARPTFGRSPQPSLDTSYVCVVDRHGN